MNEMQQSTQECGQPERAPSGPTRENAYDTTGAPNIGPRCPVCERQSCVSMGGPIACRPTEAQVARILDRAREATRAQREELMRAEQITSDVMDFRFTNAPASPSPLQPPDAPAPTLDPLADALGFTDDQRREFEARRKAWDADLKPFVDAVRASTILTAEDYAVRINARDDDPAGGAPAGGEEPTLTAQEREDWCRDADDPGIRHGYAELNRRILRYEAALCTAQATAERLKHNGTLVHGLLMQVAELEATAERLQGENETLRKAGQALAQAAERFVQKILTEVFRQDATPTVVRETALRIIEALPLAASSAPPSPRAND